MLVFDTIISFTSPSSLERSTDQGPDLPKVLELAKSKWGFTPSLKLELQHLMGSLYSPLTSFIMLKAFSQMTFEDHYSSCQHCWEMNILSGLVHV